MTWPFLRRGREDRTLTSRVEHVKTLPPPAGIGANFKGNHMFVTGTSGLFVYDIRDGDNPKPAGALPLPHYENEDVSIGGNRLLLSGDGTLGGGLCTRSTSRTPPRRGSSARSSSAPSVAAATPPPASRTAGTRGSPAPARSPC